MKTAKELASESRTVIWPEEPKVREVFYMFSEEEFQAFCDQLCKEQREICMQQIAEHPNAIRKLRHLLRNVRNAPQPETK